MLRYGNDLHNITLKDIDEMINNVEIILNRNNYKYEFTGVYYHHLNFLSDSPEHFNVILNLTKEINNEILNEIINKLIS